MKQYCFHPVLIVALVMLSAFAHSKNNQHHHYWRIELPVQSTTTINKTVRIIAPPGTTVIYGESLPLGHIYPPQYNHEQRGLWQSSNGLCVDLGEHRPVSGGMPISTQMCHGRIGQQWRWHGGRIEAVGVCLSAEGNIGTPVTGRPCVGSSTQQWLTDGLQIRSAANGLCLDYGDGAYLRLQPCSGGREQHFYGPP